MVPLGISFFFRSPASSGIEVVEAGMLKTTQCQKPLPVGASGSYTVIAKLLVSLGAPLQLNDGDALPPLQPKVFATCASLMVEPSATSPLVSFMFWANAVDALNAPNAMMPAANIFLCMMCSSALKTRILPWRDTVSLQTFVRRRWRALSAVRLLAWNFPTAGHATVDGKDCAGRVAGERRGQEDGGGRDFVGRGRTAERQRRARLMPAIGIAVSVLRLGACQALEALCRTWSRVDAPHAHACCMTVRAERLGESRHGGIADAAGDIARVEKVAADAGHIYNNAVAPCLHATKIF